MPSCADWLSSDSDCSAHPPGPPGLPRPRCSASPAERRLLGAGLRRSPGPLGRLSLLRPDDRHLPDLLPDPRRPGPLPRPCAGLTHLGSLDSARSGTQGARRRQAHLCPVRPVPQADRPPRPRNVLLPLQNARRASGQRHAQGGGPGHRLALLRRHSRLPAACASTGNARRLTSGQFPLGTASGPPLGHVRTPLCRPLHAYDPGRRLGGPQRALGPHGPGEGARPSTASCVRMCCATPCCRS
jgi:hypothetical protein